MTTTSTSASTDRPVLTMADLEEYDARAPRGRDAKERRFCCPLPACRDKPKDAAHRSLALETATGKWTCHRCGASGTLREFWAPLPDRPLTSREQSRRAAAKAFSLPPVTADAPTADPAWRAQVRNMVAVGGSPGAAYLDRRGIPLDVATAARVGYAADFYGRPGVVFGVRDAGGALVAVNVRHTDGRDDPKARTGGDKRLGVFATLGALDADIVAITEAPLDALSLAAGGLPAVAMCGTSWPSWLPRRLAFKTVLLATDADDAGDKASLGLADAVNGLARRVERLRPAPELKDWNAMLVQHGADALRSWLAPLLPPPPAAPSPDGCAVCGSPDIEYVSRVTGDPLCGLHAPKHD